MRRRRPAPALVATAWRTSASSLGQWRSRWTSASCSTPTGSSCRSAICRATASATRIATTCSPPRRGSRASSRSPRATSRPSTGSGWAAPTTEVAGGAGARLLVGLDVRVPDAVAGHARARRQPPRRDQSARRRAADRVRRRARHSVGHLGVRLQRPQLRVHLPVLELRRPRARPEARPRAPTR